MNTTTHRTIIGIDPGYGRMGVGIIRQNGARLTCISYECVMPPKGAFADRLITIHSALGRSIETHKPDIVSIEKLFFYKNVKTALDVAQARGVILLAARLHNVRICEYTPLQVKQSVCGYGRADKHQMQKMVQLLLSLPSLPKSDDAADALALAICASAQNDSLTIDE